MTWLPLLFALAVTWLPSWVLISMLIPPGVAGRASMLAGYSLLSGLILVPLAMRLLSLVGVTLNLGSISLASGLVLLLGSLLRRSRAPQSAPPANTSCWRSASGWQRALLLLCLSLLAVRLATLGMELSLRPIFAWDGKQHWAKQAKVFFEAGEIVPFVPMQQWLDLSGRDAFTNIHPDYPITVPLLQAWLNFALGEWNDSLMNLPWLWCYVALGCIFFGQLRAGGAPPLIALAACYMLLSMPLLNTHVALAGYADIFMGTCFLGGLAAFHNWTVSRERWQGLLALGCAAAGLLIKNEGFYWLLCLIPGLLVAQLGTRNAARVLSGLASAALAVCLIVPHDLSIAGHSIDSMQLAYHPESWLPILRSFWLDDNWHLLSYILALFLLANIFLARERLPQLVPTLAVMATAVGMYLALYLLTRHAYGAVNYTSLNRVALQLVPGLSFIAVLLYLNISKPLPR